MKKVIVLLIILLQCSLVGCTPKPEEVDQVIKDIDVVDTTKTEEEGEEVEGNGNEGTEQVFLHNTDTLSGLDLWNNSSTYENLILEDHYITQIDNGINGVLVTGDYFIDSFSELVPSWNVLVGDSSKISILIAVGNSEGYSKYFTMAMWREDYKSSFGNQEDDFARVSVDTIITKIENIDRIKFRIVFGKGETDTILKNISITTKESPEVYTYDKTVLREKEITVEPRQQLSIPSVGRVICSPTSLSMVLNYYNHTAAAEVVAESVYDNGSSMYGNWSFNASYAGGFEDMYSRVEYTRNLSVLMDYLNDDIPLVMSIKTSNKESLIGSIMAYPSGHLVVLTGFKQVDGEWFAIINDPAEYQDELVRREYQLDQFLEAWRGYVYVVQDIDFK